MTTTRRWFASSSLFGREKFSEARGCMTTFLLKGRQRVLKVAHWNQSMGILTDVAGVIVSLLWSNVVSRVGPTRPKSPKPAYGWTGVRGQTFQEHARHARQGYRPPHVL